MVGLGATEIAVVAAGKIARRAASCQVPL